MSIPGYPVDIEKQPSPELAQKLQPLDPGRLADQIVEIVVGDSARQDKINNLLQLTVRLVNGAGAVFFMGQGGVLQPAGQLFSRQSASMSDDVLKECRNAGIRALAEGKVVIVSMAQLPEASIISCPVSVKEDVLECCFTVLVLLGKNPPEPFLIISQLMAAALFHVGRENSGEDLLHFLSQQGGALDLRKLCDSLKVWSGCDLLAVGTRRGTGRVKLQLLNDMAKVDIRTRQSRLYIKVMQDCLKQKKSMNWSTGGKLTGFEKSLLIKELVQATGMRQGVAVLMPGIGRVATVLVFLWSEELARERRLAELGRSSSLLGPVFHAFEVASRTGTGKKEGGISGLKKTVLMGVVTALLTGLAFIPMDFTLHPDCRIMPVQVRYVVARFDSLLQKVVVDPGDQVEPGDTLAFLDGREIELELSSLEADSAKALKMRDNYLVSGAVSSAQIAFLDYQRLQNRAGLLQGRRQQLHLQSPVSGIVLSSDLKRAEGGPVVKGQVLFEIAPLNTLLLEMAVLDADVAYVEKKSKARVRFDAFPDRIWQGEIKRISPKSEVMHGQNVFIASLILKNEDSVLRPGMRGSATIECGRRTVGWVYFHKPWSALRRLLESLF